MALKLNNNDFRVLDKYAEFARDGKANPMNRALIEVFEYDPKDKYLSQKLWQKKQRLRRWDKANKIFAAVGVDKFAVAAKIKDLMNAKAPVIFHGKVMKDEDGKVVVVPELKVQMAATALASNILGITQKQKSVDIEKQVNNNLIVFVESDEDAKKRIKDEANARKRIKEEDVAHEVVQQSYEVKEETES